MNKNNNDDEKEDAMMIKKKKRTRESVSWKTVTDTAGATPTSSGSIDTGVLFIAGKEDGRSEKKNQQDTQYYCASVHHCLGRATQEGRKELTHLIKP